MHLDSQFLIFIPSAAKESGHLDLVIIFTARLKINPGTGKIAQQWGEHLPCMASPWGQSPTSQVVFHALITKSNS